MLKTVSAGLLTVVIALVPAAGYEVVDHEVNARIRKEGKEHSHIMRTLHYLTDVYGPRLTGSPNHKAAAEWAIKQMTEWGLENGHLEPWEFGHPGWANERFAGFIVSKSPGGIMDADVDSRDWMSALLITAGSRPTTRSVI